MVGMVCVAKQMPRANLLGIEDLTHVCSKVLPEIQRKSALIKLMRCPRKVTKLKISYKASNSFLKCQTKKVQKRF